MYLVLMVSTDSDRFWLHVRQAKWYRNGARYVTAIESMKKEAEYWQVQDVASLLQQALRDAFRHRARRCDSNVEAFNQIRLFNKRIS